MKMTNKFWEKSIYHDITLLIFILHFMITILIHNAYINQISHYHNLFQWDMKQKM